MGIYKLSFKNLRRNRLRNFFAVLRITFGVMILLVLLSSGLGLNTFLKQANSFDEGANVTSSHSIPSSVTTHINSLLGNFSNSSVVKKVRGLVNYAVYIIDGLASLVLLVGILDIINTMGFNLKERKKEIGTLKTFGFSKRQLLISLSLEAGFLGFFGSICGLILGSVILIFLASFIGIATSILLPIWLIIGVIPLTTILSMIIGLFPAWFACNIDVMEAFAHE